MPTAVKVSNVCMYVCVWRTEFVSTFTILVFVYMYVCMNVCIIGTNSNNIRVYINACMYVCMYVCIL